jgi:hypothetical protein
MNNHRAWVRERLEYVFSRDEEGPEFVQDLLNQYPKPEEYDTTPYGDKLRHLHFTQFAAEVENVWNTALCA